MFFRNRQYLVSSLIGLLFSTVSLAEPVDVELALLVDVSGSVDSYEFKLQQQGYADAFNDPDVINQILGTSSGTLGKIAVTLIYWSSESSQRQSIPWTLIDSESSASAFSNAILDAPRPFGGGTDIGPALDFATPLFFSNGFEGRRLVMDVSGDGVDSTAVTANARDSALAAGITTINGIVIGNDKLLGFYQQNVIGGTGAFARQVADFAGFREQVKLKIYAEVTTFPVAEDDFFLLENKKEAILDVIKNDTYAAGINEITIQALPESGEVVLNSDDTITYSPDPDFTGDDSFVYQVVDMNGRVATSTVYIKIPDIEFVIPDPENGEPSQLPIEGEVEGGDDSLGKDGEESEVVDLELADCSFIPDYETSTNAGEINLINWAGNEGDHFNRPEQIIWIVSNDNPELFVQQPQIKYPSCTLSFTAKPDTAGEATLSYRISEYETGEMIPVSGDHSFTIVIETPLQEKVIQGSEPDSDSSDIDLIEVNSESNSQTESSGNQSIILENATS